MAEVRIELIEKRIGQKTILPPLTLTVHDGEFFVLVGPSGCGKSTLLSLLAGLDQPTAGRILFDGVDVTDLEPRERDVALVFQSYALYPHMTVRENMAFPLTVVPRAKRLDRKRIEEEVERVAGFLGLSALLDRRPRELSGGQRQRVALGRALIRKPRLFLLDEPLSNLDAQLRASMRAELLRLHKELKVTTIYVTHDQTEAMTLGDRLVVLNQGRVQQIGRPHDIYAAPANLFVAGFMGYPPMNLLSARLGADSIRAGPLDLTRPPGMPPVDQAQSVTVGLRPEDLVVRPANGPGDEGNGLGVVRLTEPSGPTLWVTVELNDLNNEAFTIIGTAQAGFVPKIGERVAVSAPRTTLHLFDPTTEQRWGAG
ncbi:MAG: ABC transporter ATP-binding protein [Nitrospira sp.]|nr:ABC transporter ATP-binding protein [Nitrospira sp.]MDH4305353.1 ABC transporter ATP-binding protein [Nitrospira sp.]MDH5194289.1 ABC transporter ATP-binding protein [Nitrospira sp.]